MNRRKTSVSMAAVVAVMLLIGGCIVPAATPTPPSAPSASPTLSGHFPTPRPQPTSEQECVQQGGQWGPQGKAGLVVCNLPTLDAGQVCTDVSQCEGTCLAGDDLAATAGQCSPYTLNFGCHAIIENGERMTLCVD